MQLLKENRVIKSDSLIKEIKSSQQKNGIEGVTFLGGEPFIQPKGFLYQVHGNMLFTIQDIGLW